MAQDGRLQEAIGVWQSLAEDSPPGSPWLGLLQEQMARAAGELGIEPPVPALPQAPGAAAGPSPAAIEAAAKLTPQARHGFIRSLLDQLAGRLPAKPGDHAGWLRFARASTALGAPEKARKPMVHAGAKLLDPYAA